MAINRNMVTTAFELPGHRVVQNVGVVRGIIVRSRSIVGSIGAGLQTLFGGNITIYTELCEKARGEAFPLRRIGQPEEVAKVVLHLASGDADWTTGLVYVMDGGRTLM